MKKLIAGAVLIAGLALSGSLGGWIERAFAQGMVRLSTFGSGAQISVNFPCTVSCYVTASSGTFTANGATGVVVADTNMTANSVVMFGLKTVGGTPAGSPFLSATTPGTGFTVKAIAGDTSIYNYVILN